MVFLHKFNVRRQEALGTNGRMTRSIVATDVQGLFLPMPSRYEMESGFTIGSGYDVYTPTDADVKTGDQLIWGDGTYNVRAVRTYDVPIVAHKHVLATREGL